MTQIWIKKHLAPSLLSSICLQNKCVQISDYLHVIVSKQACNPAKHRSSHGMRLPLPKFLVLFFSMHKYIKKNENVVQWNLWLYLKSTTFTANLLPGMWSIAAIARLNLRRTLHPLIMTDQGNYGTQNWTQMDTFIRKSKNLLFFFFMHQTFKQKQVWSGRFFTIIWKLLNFSLWLAALWLKGWRHKWSSLWLIRTKDFFGIWLCVYIYSIFILYSYVYTVCIYI